MARRSPEACLPLDPIAVDVRPSAAGSDGVLALTILLLGFGTVDEQIDRQDHDEQQERAQRPSDRRNERQLPDAGMKQNEQRADHCNHNTDDFQNQRSQSVEELECSLVQLNDK